MSLDYAQFAIVVAGMLLLVGASPAWIKAGLSRSRSVQSWQSIDQGEASRQSRAGTLAALVAGH